uniref:Nodulin-like domain-containing protein n=1 Tax=Glycine max TaxID=3847 RepID=K7KY67_SOYBN
MGTIPCITLLLGGNLTQGLKSSNVKPLTLISIIIAPLFLLPYVLVMQYAMPPAMNISTMAQLFEVGNEEHSVILLWTYSAAAIALTAWLTFLLWLFLKKSKELVEDEFSTESLDCCSQCWSC